MQPLRRMSGRGFTVLELLVATVILLLLVGLLVSVNDHTMRLCRQTSTQADAFQSARLAFDVMIRQFTQATLNPYWDYDNSSAPTRYLRKSDLAFVSGQASSLLPAINSPPRSPGHACFFQAPLGRMNNNSRRELNLLLNTCGFFIEYADANANAAMPRPVRNRYRLMHLQTSAEEMTQFGSAAVLPPSNLWFTSPLAESRVLAENIILLVVRPRSGQGTDLGYTLDTRLGQNDTPQPVTSNQLPPLLDLTMIAVSEASMNRTNATNGYVLPASALSRFSTPSQYEDDFQAFSELLDQAKLDYRLFSQQIALPASKWSE